MENSYLEISQVDGLVVITPHDTRVIQGVCCDDHEANITCCGVAAFESDRPKKDPITGKLQRIRISNEAPTAISKEIKFLYYYL